MTRNELKKQGYFQTFLPKRSLAAGALAALALTFLFMLSALASPAAAEADINGWTAHKGPDYDLYMADNAQVGAYELVMLINYDVHDITLELWETNGTKLQSETVAPSSSEVIELDYGTVDCTIKVVNTYYGLEGSYNRVHVYDMLPPASSSTSDWTLNPPTGDDDSSLIYSADDLADKLAAWTVEFFIKAPPVFMFGAILGYADKKITMLRKPTDVFTLAFFAAIGLDVVTSCVTVYTGFGFNRAWYVILCMGYIVSRQLTHLDTISPIRINCTKSQHTVRKEVVYTQKGHSEMYLALQTNRDMLKRLVLGMHVPLGADGALVPEWTINIERRGIRKPYQDRGFWIQKEQHISEPGPTFFFGLFKTRKHSVQYELANASAWPKPMFIQQMNAFLELGDENKALNAELVKEKMLHSNEASSYARAQLVRAFGFTRSAASREYLQKEVSAPQITESREDQLTEIEDAATAPQEDDRTDQESDVEEINEQEDERTPEEAPKKANRTRKNHRRSKNVTD